MGPGELSGKPDEMLGGNLQCTSIPSGRNRNTCSPFMIRKLTSLLFVCLFVVVVVVYKKTSLEFII